MNAPQRTLISSVLVLIFCLLAACNTGGDDRNAPPPVVGSDGNTPPPVGSSLDSTVLRWDAPLQRVDVTSLSPNEIDGYKIYTGNEEDNLTLLTDITDASITTYTVQNLSPGTHYFAITAYDIDGVESSLSNIKSKTF